MYIATQANEREIMNNNKSTEAQRSFIASLAKRIGDNERVANIIAPAFAINGNRAWSGSNCGGETLTQATNRITKTAASRMIELLKSELA